VSLPAFSVQRPIFTTMVTLIAVTLGLVAFTQIRIDMLPAVEMPRLTVRANYDGADPVVMERLVTQPIEEIVATVPGVEEITSVSGEGSTNVRVAFAWGTDLDVAAQDLRSRLENELDELPEEVTRPSISKFDIASFPVVIMGIGSALDPIELTDILDEQVRYRFSRIPGVAQVDMWGEFKREVRVELDLGKLRALQLPLDAVLAAIRDSNVDVPAGQIEEGRYEVRLRAPAEFRSVEQVRATVVTTREGAPISLGDIARIRDTHERLTRVVRVNGEPGIRMAVRKQADANTVEVADRVLAEIERVNADFPQLEVVSVINQGNLIERSIQNVANSVLYGGGLAVLVLLFFLRSVRSTVVISVVIPVSIVATFALVYFAGFTLNLMTLGGLALGVGMMVDSSIVVLENIVRRRDENDEPIARAAVEGTREVATAILASTITTVIIFLPLMLVDGVSGLLFRELAYVVAFSLMASLVVALTVVPMLAARLLPSGRLGRLGAATAGEGSLAARAEARFDALGLGYRRLLTAALGRRAHTVVAALAITAASAALIPGIGTEFMPPSDEGEVRVNGEMEIGTRLGLVDRQLRRVEELVYPAVPELRAVVASAGSSSWRPDSGAESDVRLSLGPAAERTRSNTEIAAELRQLLEGQVPGVKIRVRAPQGQFILQRILGRADEGVTIEIRGYELDVLTGLAARAAEVVPDVDGVTDVRVSRKAGVPQSVLQVRRDKAAALGLSVRQVAEAIETAVAGRRAGEFRPAGQSYRILVQLRDVEKLPLDEILGLTIETPDGTAVALRNVVEVVDNRGPVLIDRKDQQRVITVEANVAGRDTGSVAADIEEALRSIPRPVGYELSVAGTLEEQRKSFDQLSLSLIVALLLVYMVLACQYESLRDPLVVMFSVPVAGVGVLVTLWATNTTLNVQSFIGCIMLGGIVVNNAILLVDQGARLCAQGVTVVEAAAEAGRRRLRPILMTTLTTVLGLLPLALGIGEGAEAQAPLARAVIGGLVGSTAITLVLIPVMFTLIHRPVPAKDAG